MSQHRYSLVDVFAAQPLEGNLLAVIEDADGIDDATMATLAMRFRLSETSFIQTATSPTADYRHRIYIVEGEIPFAGHPSLGTAAVWTQRKGLKSADLVQQTLAGEQKLHVELDGSRATVSLRMNAVEFGAVADAAPVLAAIGLPDSAAHPTLKPQLLSVGLPTLLFPLADAADLARIRIDLSTLGAAMTQPDGFRPLTLYVVAESAPGHWRARSFGTDIAGGEDPATGSAAGPFGEYLRVNTGLTELVVRQGVEMGCPSELRVNTTDGVVVSGDVQFVGEGTMTLP